jgi:hypothetical protein
MKDYKQVYEFNVLSEIEKGNTVCMVDKQLGLVLVANDTPAEVLLKAIKNKENERYYFYKEIETEGNE